MSALAHSPRPGLVSIAMPVYNGVATVEAAVRSVLAQTYSDWEVLLLDDGSTDGTSDVLKSFDDPRIRVFVDEVNRGRSYRLNQAIALARGTYFARLDADDLAFPDRIARQVAFLDTHQEVDVVGTGMMMFSHQGEVLGYEAACPSHADIVARPWARIRVSGATKMGRTAWFRRFRYDERAVRGEDQDILLRSYTQSRFANLPDMLYAYRFDPLRLSAVLANRYYFAHVLLRQARRTRSFPFAVGALAQGAKGVSDIATRLARTEGWMQWRGWTPLDAQQNRAWDDLRAHIEKRICVESVAS